MTHAALPELQRVVDGWAAAHSRRPVRVLEAGCGSTTHLRLPAGAAVTGIDISEAQLARNVSVDRKILGDVQSYDFCDERFDLIICWDVLEHVRQPLRAMNRLIAAAADGALVVVAVPNLWSIKGLVAKLTPFAVHRWFYLSVMAERPSRGGAIAECIQHPTLLRKTMAPRRLKRFAESRGLAVRYFRTYEGPVQAEMRRRFRLAGSLFAIIGLVTDAVTFGSYDLTHSDAVLAAEFRAEAAVS